MSVCIHEKKVYVWKYKTTFFYIYHLKYISDKNNNVCVWGIDYMLCVSLDKCFGLTGIFYFPN